MPVDWVRVKAGMFTAFLMSLALITGATPLNDVNPTAQRRATHGKFPTARDAPTKEWSITLSSPYCVGVTPVQDTLMWVSAGQSDLKIYVYNIKDPAHPLVDSFPQTDGPTGWGIRDMAWKGSTNEVFAGYDNQRFNVYDATTHEVKHQYVVSGYGGVVRGFAYSPYQDSCWTCDFDSAPMTKFSINGANGHAVKPASEMVSAYGLAFDRYQHCFWVTQAGTPGASPTLKMDYAYNVVDSFNADGWAQGGGCEMWRDTFLLQLNQGDPDEVFCMRFNLPPLPDHNVGVSAIVSPAANINPGVFTPTARVMNFGSNPETVIPGTCWIDSAGIRVYSASETLAGPLGPGLEADVAFSPDWDAGPVGAEYGVAMFTTLDGDEESHDDTLFATTTVRGAIFSDTIHVHAAGSSVLTIDGNITAGEWSASDAYDVSDIDGRAGSPQPAGSCLARFLYDSAFVYIAVDCPNRTTRVDLDQFGPFMDEDKSGWWSTDSSEGGYAVEYVQPDDHVAYRAALDTLGSLWEMGVAPGAASASSLASGHLQFEAEIPVGAFKWQLNVQGGDTVGYFQYTAVDSLGTYIGWWPRLLTVPEWPNPRYYGTMVFDTMAPGIRSRDMVAAFALYRASPSLVRDRSDIRFYVGRQADVSLSVYDVSGSLVKILERGRFGPGERTVAWNRTDDAGTRVASGAYFYRLDVDGESVSSKAVVLK
jgi:hypothetical protein